MRRLAVLLVGLVLIVALSGIAYSLGYRESGPFISAVIESMGTAAFAICLYEAVRIGR